MDHCRVCGIDHSSGACAGCVGAVRDDLAEISELWRDVDAEAEAQGVDSEAMVLLGPVADPEAWGHVSASIACGRLPADWRLLPADWTKSANDENHPLLVLGDWEMVYRDAWDQQTIEPADVERSAAYLTRHLSEAASEPWVPFEELAKAVRRSRAYVEHVLHDGEQVDRGAPCMSCGKQLERTWGMDEDHDGWRCPKCRTTSTDAQYRFAVAHLHRVEATHLTDRDMEIRTGVKAGTVRVWAQRGLIQRVVESGRVVFVVAEVEAEARQRGLLAS